ncbi:signal recognition particle-docking protein FtsY [Candidatus Woesearchaeota archaeon]|nr:signal recognition particle-docking protein FtsY [Candidatus Woesearchaeota archaeon]
MFKFLKDKLKNAVSKFTKDVEEEAEDIVDEVVEPEQIEKPPVEDDQKEDFSEEQKEQPVEPEQEPSKDDVEEKEEIHSEKVKPSEESKPEQASDDIEEEPEISAELTGLKESLDEYSDEDLDSLMSMLSFPAKSKNKKKESKINNILKKPLMDISSAIDKLDAIEETVQEISAPEIVEPEKEPEEEIIEEPDSEHDDVNEEQNLDEKQKIEPDEEDTPLEEEPEKKGFLKKLFSRKKKEEPEQEETTKEPKEEPEQEPEQEETTKEPKEEPEQEPEEKTGILGRIRKGIVSKKLSDSKFEDIFFDLEVALLENNVAVEVIEKIKDDLRQRLVDQKVERSKIGSVVMESLVDSIKSILSIEQIDLVSKAKEKEGPYVIVFVGINGSGKTTTIAKVAKHFMDNGMKPVLVASDTFRAAAIQQLEEHAVNLDVKIIKHDYGSDPAAVAFDGIKYAKAKNADVVLIDTAGRLHSNVNLMDEMKKIIRIADPDAKIFVGESITGNDCIEQAQKFNEAVDIDGIILSKTDVDEKGGAAISVSYVTGKPILFIGTGQTYDGLSKFDKSIVLESLGMDD